MSEPQTQWLTFRYDIRPDGSKSDCTPTQWNEKTQRWEPTGEPDVPHDVLLLSAVANATQLPRIMSDFQIPEISDAELAKRQAQIQPVVLRDDGLYFIKPVDPRAIAFTWEPRPTTKAEGLVELQVIETLHSYGAPSLFKPSIAEVLAQIPEDILPRVVAFRTELMEDTLPEMSKKAIAALNEGYHLAQTTLYTR